MSKYNRGKTEKLNIRLSTRALDNIKKAAKNLGISAAGVILFELSQILKNLPSKSDLEEIENRITLERKHFVITITEDLRDRIDALAEDYGMKKNVLIGYMVSNQFDKMEDVVIEEDLEPKRLMVHINENLKKKMMEYSEKHFIPLNALVSYSILQGPYEGLPSYEDGEMVQFFTNVPSYIGEMVKQRAEENNIREHFYTSLCLYKQFMTTEGRFFE